MFDEGKIVFFVASRAHHADIGGLTAGEFFSTLFLFSLLLPLTSLLTYTLLFFLRFDATVLERG